MSPIHQQMSSKEWGLIALLSFIWGSSFFFQGVVVRELPPLTIVLLRVGIAALCMTVYIRITGQRWPITRQTLLPFVGLGLIGLVLPFSLLVWAQTHITSSLASILNALTPMTTMVVAHFFTSDEKMNLRKFCGMIIGFSGVAYMIGTDVLLDSAGDVVAQIACVCAGLCYAFASTFGRRFSVFKLTPTETATGQCIMATLLLLPIIFIFEPPLNTPAPTLQGWGAVIGLAVISTAMAYMLYFKILTAVGATNIVLVTFLVPVTAITLGILILGEVLEGKHLIGALSIAVGLAIIDGRLLNRLVGRAPKATLKT